MTLLANEPRHVESLFVAGRVT